MPLVPKHREHGTLHCIPPRGRSSFYQCRLSRSERQTRGLESRTRPAHWEWRPAGRSIWVACYLPLDVHHPDTSFCSWDKLLEKFPVFLEWGLRHGSSNKLPDVANADDLPKSEEQGSNLPLKVFIRKKSWTTYQLCDSGEVMSPLLVSVSSSAN